MSFFVLLEVEQNRGRRRRSSSLLRLAAQREPEGRSRQNESSLEIVGQTNRGRSPDFKRRKIISTSKEIPSDKREFPVKG